MDRVHKVVGDMLRTQDLKQHTFDSIDTWGPILNEVAWAIRSTYHTTSELLQANWSMVEICYSISLISLIGRI